MRLGLVSLDQMWQDKEVNKASCQSYLEQAAADRCELVVYPEMTLTGFSMKPDAIAEDLSESSTVHWFANQAAQNGVAVAFGVVLRHNSSYTNNLVVVDRTGSVLERYAKIHPFSFSGENHWYVAGDRLATAVVRSVTIGLTICYDLRFPELYQALADRSHAILCIANWPASRVDHWRTLLKARAIETQAYVVGVNRTGADPVGNSYERSTEVYGPSGEAVRPVTTHGDLDVVDISIGEADRIRAAFPVRNDRRKQLYGTFL